MYAAGATADDCDASPRDLFVTREGVVYFIEGSELSGLTKKGKSSLSPAKDIYSQKVNLRVLIHTDHP